MYYFKMINTFGVEFQLIKCKITNRFGFQIKKNSNYNIQQFMKMKYFNVFVKKIYKLIKGLDCMKDKNCFIQKRMQNKK